MDQGRAEARTQQTFAALEPDLAPDVSELLRVPPDAQADLNLVSMCNFLPLLWPLLEDLNPKSVCEIGADLGTTTRVLTRWCRDGSRALTVVDPTTDPTLEDDDVVSYARVTSLEYLADAPPADLYFIDGDHNYFTVHGELEAIAAVVPPTATCLLLMHDVAWPCGRRDMYYDPDTIPESDRRAVAASPVLTLRRSSLGEVGLPTDEFRLVEPDPAGKHGIRTAIEDFVSSRPEWRFISLPSIHGLGVVWYAGDAAETVTDRLEALAQDFRRWEGFLATLELNRLQLLEQRERDGREWSIAQGAVAGLEGDVRRTATVWEEQQRYIEELEERAAGQEKAVLQQAEQWDAQQRYIQELEERAAGQEKAVLQQAEQWDAQQRYIQELEARLADQEAVIAEHQAAIVEREAWNRQKEHEITRQAHMWADQQRVIDELTERTTAQARTIGELHRPLGWVRFRVRNR